MYGCGSRVPPGRSIPDLDYAFADVVGTKYGADLRTMDKPGGSLVVVAVRPVKRSRCDSLVMAVRISAGSVALHYLT
jgi:hypothetical protein